MRFILLDRLDFLASPQLRSSRSSRSSRVEKTRRTHNNFYWPKKSFTERIFFRRSGSARFSIHLPDPNKKSSQTLEKNIFQRPNRADPVKRWNNYCKTLDRLDWLDLTERALKCESINRNQL